MTFPGGKIDPTNAAYRGPRSPSGEIRHDAFGQTPTDYPGSVPIELRPPYAYVPVQPREHKTKPVSVDVHARDKDGATPLFEACFKGDLETVRLLLANGADINARAHSGTTPLHCACMKAGHAEVVQLLLHNNAVINGRDNEGAAPLHYASSDLEVTRILISNGAIVDPVSSTGTPLHHAIMAGRTEVVRFLVSQGANPNSVDSHGNVPVSLAVKVSEPEIVSILLAAGGRDRP